MSAAEKKNVLREYQQTGFELQLSGVSLADSGPMLPLIHSADAVRNPDRNEPTAADYFACGQIMLIGIMTYGGGYSVLPLVEDLIVRQRGWLSASEVADIVSISEMSPGPFSLNCSSFVGMKVAGVPGALMATTGFLLPPLVIVLALALLYRRIRSASAAGKVFAVLNACIIAVLLASAVNLFSSSVLGGLQAGGKIDILALVLFLASFLVLFRWKVNPVYLLLASGVIGAVIFPLIQG